MGSSAKLDKDDPVVTPKCLQKEPARRYAGAGDLAADLAHFLAGEPIQARPVGRAERLARWCRRNPMLASLTIAAATLLVVAAVSATAAAFWYRLLARREEQLRNQAVDRADAGARTRAEKEASLYIQSSLNQIRRADENRWRGESD